MIHEHDYSPAFVICLAAACGLLLGAAAMFAIGG